MKALVREAMEAGAIGLSTSLIYPPAVFASEVRLGQVFLNLIVNAAQAMDGLGRQGHIEVGWFGLRWAIREFVQAVF